MSSKKATYELFCRTMLMSLFSQGDSHATKSN